MHCAFTSLNSLILTSFALIFVKLQSRLSHRDKNNKNKEKDNNKNNNKNHKNPQLSFLKRNSILWVFNSLNLDIGTTVTGTFTNVTFLARAVAVAVGRH